MANRKEWEMLFNLNAKMGSSFTGTFNSAKGSITSLQNEISGLMKTQGDISAYQKQETAVENTRKHLELLQQQYANIKKEMSETDGYSSKLENQLLSKQEQIDKTNASLQKNEQQLGEMGAALNEAGVDTNNLTGESKRLEAEMSDLRGEQEKAADGATDFGERTVKAFDAAGSAIMAAGVAQALGKIKDGYVECITAAGDFEQSMSGVEALSGASKTELDALTASAREMGATTSFTAKQSADAFGYMALAGWDTESMLEGIQPVLNLAAAANMDLAEASDIVTDYLTAFGLKAEDTSGFVDMMAYAMSKSNTNVTQLGEAYKNCAATSTSLGYSVEETTAVLMTMANAGVKGGEAGTALNAIMTRLATDTKGCASELSEYGVEVYNAQGQMNSLSSILTGISGVWDNLTDQQQANLAKTIAGTHQYSSLQTIMTGCSEAAKEGGQSFTDYATALANSSGTAGKMANTMLDNMNGKLTLMQSAFDGLKISLGEKFAPVMSKVYEILADVLTGLTEFVDEHPAIIRALGAGIATLGTLLTAITGVNAAIKLGSVLLPLLTGAIPGVNVLVGVAAATVGIATAVGVLSAGAEDAVPSVTELTEAARNMGNGMEDASNQYDTSLSKLSATNSVADEYIAKLEAIEQATGGNTAGNVEYHDTLARLSSLIPELSQYIDLETDSINGGTEALKNHKDAFIADAEAQAKQEYLKTLYEKYNDVLVESAENETQLAIAQNKANTSRAGMASTYDQLLKVMGLTDEQFKSYYGTVQDIPWRGMGDDVKELREQYLGYSDDVATAEKSVANYTAAVAEDQSAVEAAKDEYAAAKDVIDGVISSTDGAASSANAAAYATGGMQSAMETATASMQPLIESYNAAYDAALTSINGQYQLWDQAAAVVETSAATINGAMESQITYWNNYNDNLAALNDRAGDIEGLGDVIASFADGSTESVNAIAGMASASDEDLQQMVANYQNLQTAQSDTSESLADLETGFSNSMDGIVTSVTEAVGEMDLTGDAKDAATKTVQGYVDGANEMLPKVQTAYQAIANAAKNAMSGVGNISIPAVVPTVGASGSGGFTNGAKSLRGFAEGTENAEPGFARVGEHGPEVVYLNGGETIATAEETRAMDAASDYDTVAIAPQLVSAMRDYKLSANMLNAEMGGGSSGGRTAINVAPVYNISGVSDAAGVQAALAEHDANLRDFILDVVDEAERDKVRRRF